VAKFAIGEIAIAGPGVKDWATKHGFYNGMEVEVISAPSINENGDIVYYIDSPLVSKDRRWRIKEICLRKRPQPPDWLALIDNLPIEELV